MTTAPARLPRGPSAGVRNSALCLRYGGACARAKVGGRWVVRPGAPHIDEIEQDCVLRLGVRLFRRLRPVAAPHHALGRGLLECFRDRRDVGVARRPDHGIVVG